MFIKKLILSTSALVALAGSAAAQVANVTPTDLTPAGFNTTLNMATAPSPSYIPNDGESLIVARTAAAAVTLTIRTKATTMSQAGYGSVTLTDQVVVIPSGTTFVMGPFPPGRWNDTQFGTIKVDASAPISLTTLRVPQ